ncbi:hypothetical protein GF367_01570 [Candidatus Woesearchaeota archaeon]|nr:hypothetical protein [Candidatus Woesearchaeota archaeon]
MKKIIDFLTMLEEAMIRVYQGDLARALNEGDLSLPPYGQFKKVFVDEEVAWNVPAELMSLAVDVMRLHYLSRTDLLDHLALFDHCLAAVGMGGLARQLEDTIITYYLKNDDTDTLFALLDKNDAWETYWRKCPPSGNGDRLAFAILNRIMRLQKEVVS